MTVFEKYTALGNGLNRFSCLLSGNCLAHHGIQRSGTNYLLRILIDLNLRPLNAFDPERSNPKHKHFRWQPEKSSIKIHDVYKNNIVVSSLDALNSVAGYPKTTKHIVIFKPAVPWLASILNWGMVCGWYENIAEATSLESITGALGEYDAYYCFWQEVAETNRSSVEILRHSDVIERPIVVAEALDSLGIRYSTARITRDLGRYSEVKMSPVNRKSYIDNDTHLQIGNVARDYNFEFAGARCLTNANYP